MGNYLLTLGQARQQRGLTLQQVEQSTGYPIQKLKQWEADSGKMEAFHAVTLTRLYRIALEHLYIGKAACRGSGVILEADIEELECSSEFSLANFGESTYTNDRGRTYPKYLITQDGFSFLP